MNNRDLRLLVTKYCNYKCQFCHEEGVPEWAESLLTPEDYEYFYKIMNSELEFGSVTLTGGEPLLRNDIDEICMRLYRNGCQITLTTNGYLLGERSSIGKYLRKVNISLHTLNKEKYETIVQRNGAFDKFVSSIKEFRRKNLDTNIVFNVTVVKGINNSVVELSKIIDFAKSNNASIKFIELFPSTETDCVTLEELKELLLELNFSEVKSNHRVTILHDGCTYITLTRIFCEVQKNSEGENVCKEYNDLFIAPNGKIKPCRNQEYTISIIDAIKSRDAIALTNKVQKCINCMGDNCMMQILECTK